MTERFGYGITQENVDPLIVFSHELSVDMTVNDFEIPPPFEYVDLYCERTGPGFWNEPLNATTNVVFFFVAWLSWRRAREAGNVSSSIQIPILLTVAIGAGSFLFHTLATRWAMAMDVVPILLYKLAFLWTYGRSVLKWNMLSVASVGIGLLVVSLVGLQHKHLLNGSLLYLPGCLLLVCLGGLHVQRDLPERWSLLIASGLLLMGIIFRSLDRALCETTSAHGTHFLWHICTGGVICFTLRCMIFNLVLAVSLKVLEHHSRSHFRKLNPVELFSRVAGRYTADS